MAKHEEYDWLNDPFDEKKAQAERERAQAGGGMRLAGCAIAVLLCVAFLIVAFALGMSALGSLG